jgi:hypothetical protein
VELTQTERLIVTGLQAREREVQRLHVEPLQADFRLALRLIEERLGLPAGAIFTTHALDFETLTVIPVAQPAAETAEDEVVPASIEDYRHADD